jgi:hypothetical protein
VAEIPVAVVDLVIVRRLWLICSLIHKLGGKDSCLLAVIFEESYDLAVRIKFLPQGSGAFDQSAIFQALYARVETPSREANSDREYANLGLAVENV